MKPEYPGHVTLIEVGPRDGFQFESQIIPTGLKLDIIRRLVASGLKEIQVASFVNPERVPQMADAEELAARLPEAKEVVFWGLALNSRGVERAFRAGIRHVEISVSASEAHSRKNMGMTIETAMNSARDMVRMAQTLGIRIRVSIQCAFGCGQDSDIPLQRVISMVSDFLDWGAPGICLADTAGTAGPLSIREGLDAVLPRIGGANFGLHLHDTWGLGIANVLTALSYGVNRFDCSFGGMGGCPFLPGASGNIATEDTAGLMTSLGVDVGVDVARIAECSRMMEAYLGKGLPGKRYRLLAGAVDPGMLCEEAAHPLSTGGGGPRWGVKAE